MAIYLGRRGVRQIRDAAGDAIEDRDTEALGEEILDALSEDDIQLIQRKLGGEDVHDFINVMLDDWSGDDVDELLELMESQFSDIGIDLTTDFVDVDEVLEEDEDGFLEGDDFDDFEG